MASKWALAKAQKALGDAVDGDNMQYCNCKSCVRVVAQALDAAAEEVAKAAYAYAEFNFDFRLAMEEGDFVKRVVDKLGNHGS